MESRMTARLPAVRGTIINLCSALWLLAALNQPFWSALWDSVGGWQASRAGFLVTLPLFALVWVWTVLELLTWGRAAKPVLGIVLVLSAAVAFFMHRYGISFDRGMFTNVMETDPAEARELISGSMVLWILGLGVAPAMVIAMWPRAQQSIVGTLTEKLLTLSGLMLVAGAILVLQSGAYISLFRSHRDLRLQLVPTNYLSAAHSYAKVKLKPKREIEQISLGATRVASDPSSQHPMVLVLVVGETMRAANLSVNGYERETTPLLAARQNLVNFGRAESCGTATAVSLPCMFLDVGRGGYEDGMAFRRESLLDVLQRAGMDVWWLSNNSGCKGVCDRVQVVDVPATLPGDACGPGGCQDDVLVSALQERLDNVQRDTVVVVHMKGQHGPSYYLRYPPAFERYRPACQDNALDRCGPEQVVNAYDNAVSYSDYILDRIIMALQSQADRIDSSMIFVSDHGESLGEKGVFLHGMPYSFAPTVQKQVPFMAWLPKATQDRLGIDANCLVSRRDQLSHDNLYHSILGLTSTQASTYRNDRDVFSSCRTGPVVGGNPKRERQ